jgi:hypothetical protein
VGLCEQNTAVCALKLAETHAAVLLVLQGLGGLPVCVLGDVGAAAAVRKNESKGPDS